MRKAGGLYILGTERHESRRIDNQLRGRSGRQGDPGMTRFFLSLEDDLMRLFGGDRVQRLMDTLGVEEDMPIENKMITSVIESAQKKIEGQNFSIRKNVLSFDDVMNQQREIIYGERNRVLQGDDVSESVRKMIRESITETVAQYTGGENAAEWDLSGLRDHYRGWLCVDSDFNYDKEQLASLHRDEVGDLLIQRAEKICARQGAEVRQPDHAGTRAGGSAAGGRHQVDGITSTIWMSCARASICAATASGIRLSSTESRALTCSMRWSPRFGRTPPGCC